MRTVLCAISLAAVGACGTTERLTQPRASFSHVVAPPRYRVATLPTLGGKVIGKGSYRPGWKWSRTTGGRRMPAHVGVVLSGRAKARDSEGHETDLLPGDFFHLRTASDVWVVGYRSCEILYVSGVQDLIHELQRLQ